MKEHHYQCEVIWEGNLGTGTSAYTAYAREHLIRAEGKHQEIQGSADPAFRGDPERFNPEELFLSSLSSCHMLWYLHLCSTHGIAVLSYKDTPEGIMQEDAHGGRFKRVQLRPEVVIKSSQDTGLALKLHEEANRKCFIANSCNFRIDHAPTIISN